MGATETIAVAPGAFGWQPSRAFLPFRVNCHFLVELAFSPAKHIISMASSFIEERTSGIIRMINMELDVVVGSKKMNARKGIRRLRLQREAEGYLELGMPQHALSSLARIGDPSSLDSSALYLWGEALRSLERYEEAIIPLQRAAESAPENINIRLALGWCFKRVGRIHKAIETLEQALASEPNEPLLRYNLACYFSLAGNKNRAIRYLSQALGLAPGYRSLIDSESDFDSLRHDPDFLALCEKVKG